jgi:hypothetical protein
MAGSVRACGLRRPCRYASPDPPVQHLVIASWRIKTLPCVFDDESIESKIARYRTKANAVVGQMEAEAQRHGIASPRLIFLAPEHLFRRSRAEMALHQGQKDQLMGALKEISGNHRDAMIIPGTVVWRAETAYAKLLRRRFEARNTAFVFQHGSILHQYNKHTDAGELTEAERHDSTYRAGQKLGVFTCWGLRFGLEICNDHAHSTLLTQIAAKKQMPVDVHLILSSTIANKPGKMAARDGGLVVHADGADDKSSHTAQVQGVGAKSGVWEMRERALPIGIPNAPPNPEEHRRLNRGQYVDLKRRMSVTMRGREAPHDEPRYPFEGFDDDVSVYYLRLGG